jgi:RNA polymerase sigma-70 factor (ECF subfamily)
MWYSTAPGAGAQLIDGFVVEPVENEPPETLFQRQWARVLLQRTNEALREEFARAGKQVHFDRLQPFLVAGKSDRSYGEIARDLDVTESAVKMSVHRLRRRFGELLRDEVSNTVADADKVDSEIRYLFDALRR